MRRAIFSLLLLLSFSLSALATEPVVAIHYSELTVALESMTAAGSTPTGSGTTGRQWWTPWWHYFVMPESLQEALRSDGTPFVLVSDADVSAGDLLSPDGTPRYPIVISLASEAIRDDEIARFRDYVAAGGFLFVGSSSFTRNPDGTSRGDFALAAEMGLHSATAGFQNWYLTDTFLRLNEHRLVSHIPSGTLMWRMPATADEISWGISPTHHRNELHYIWQVSAGDATVIAASYSFPYILTKSYGSGTFIYHAAMQPLIGNGGPAPGMYAYGIFRNAIEWAFEAAGLPMTRLSPWPYPYNAAYVMRHDFENLQYEIQHIEASAAVEYTFGAKGDYYFCTGTLRDELADSPSIVDSLRRAVALYGATIGAHNGGLANPNNTGLSMADYDYWHWGLDESIDASPAGYTSGSDYARASLSLALADVDRWMTGLNTNTRTWASPYFNATRDESLKIQEEQGIVAAGEQKLSPFPHWAVSTQTQGRRFSFVTLPTSDWYINSVIAQTIDERHDTTTIHQAVDYYYNLGALLNLYTHETSRGGYPYEFMSYCASKTAIWATNAAEVAGWWTRRSPVQIVPTYSSSDNDHITTITVTGATDPETSIEVSIPNWAAVSDDLTVTLNGLPAGQGSYRTYHQGIKVNVGTSVSVVQVTYPLEGPYARNDEYRMVQGGTLQIAAPGVLDNDATGGELGLTAALVNSASEGVLVFHSDGSFGYTPGAGFSGVDSFSYQVISAGVPLNTATVSITVIPLVINLVTLSPASVTGGTPVQSVVTLNGAAPAGGAVVSLTSSNTAAAQVPASVTVAAGATTATFPATTSAVTSSTAVTIAAVYNSVTRTATLTVTAAVAALSAVSVSPATVLGGVSATGTVTLDNPAPAGGAVVSLTSSNTAAAQVPASVTVAAGATTATFPATTSAVSVTIQVTISASCAGTSASAVITVLPFSSGLTIFSDDFTGLSGSDPLWTTRSGTWSVDSGVMTGTSATNSYGFAYVDGNWTDYRVSSRLRFPAGAYGGGMGGRLNASTGAHYGFWIYPERSAGGTVLMGLVKFRRWTDWSGTFMAQVTLPAMGTGWHTLEMVFQSTRIQVFYDKSQVIDVTDNGFDSRAAYASGGISMDLYTASAPYLLSFDDVLVTSLVAPVAALSAVSVSPATVLGGVSATGTVTLDNPAPTGGAVVSLTSSNTAAAQVPASVTVAAGATTATFPATTSAVTSSTAVTIAASYNKIVRRTSLTINAPTLASLVLIPSSVQGGVSSTGTVTLNGPAPQGGILVTLSSSRTAVAQVPTSVRVAAGKTTANFAVTTFPVTSVKSVTITAKRGTTIKAILTVTL